MGIIFTLNDDKPLTEISHFGKLATIFKAAKYCKQLGIKNGKDENDGSYTWLIRQGGIHKGYERIIDESNDIDELIWLRREFNVSTPQLQQVRNRIEKVNKLGLCKETRRYYEGVKKMYIDKGITVKMVDKAIEGHKQQLAHISRRIKELRSLQKDE